MADLPRDQLMKAAQEAIQRHRGFAVVYFKFTCRRCGARCTLAEANMLREKGECAECGFVTPITQGGFMLHLMSRPP